MDTCGIGKKDQSNCGKQNHLSVAGLVPVGVELIFESQMCTFRPEKRQRLDPSLGGLEACDEDNVEIAPQAGDVKDRYICL